MRILVIEDDLKIASAIKKGLEQESFAVDVSTDGSDGLGSAMVTEYDLIILDRMLPGVRDGLDICRIIRKNKKNTPIIILTARDKIEDRVEGLNCGADDYLVKPFAFEELVARIKALLRRPKASSGDIFKIDDLEIDTLKRTVKRGGIKISLSITEYRLLEYLVRHPNQVLPKDNIIEHVWNFDADILPNTVEVYVGYLRNKIDKPFPKKNNLVHTVRGFGYKIGEIE